jgi:anti-anti-sigma factor
MCPDVAGPDVSGVTGADSESHPQLDLDVREQSGRAWHVTGRGELDAATAPLLANRVDELIAAGTTFVVLDLSEVSFVDSSGLRAIIESGRHLEARDGRLVIDGMSPAVERILEVTSLLEAYRR